MALSKLRIQQAKSRIITGKIMDILCSRNLLRVSVPDKLETFNGIKVMMHSVRMLTIEEMNDLENDIEVEINQII